MSGSFPIYETYSECSSECNSFVSHCAGQAPLIVCQLNIIVFLVCIFSAVFTGVVLPVLCLLCCVTNWCADARRIWRTGHASDEETVKLNPRSVQVSVSDSGTATLQPVAPQRKAMSKGTISFA
ncbi:unnamed protein product [Cylicocyclus nassatus]|uniref:Uncharacterized protein n=1 Tax=Cylicocyclus nassatus TaxID=53992 RepID=A0AA36DPE2_CYLNA|nr:unnamed protein product [Cylicocyclus nassatus]